jgi:hypothetical protein
METVVVQLQNASISPARNGYDAQTARGVGWFRR